MRISSLIPTVVLAIGAQQAVHATPPASGPADGVPVTVARARQFDITAASNGRRYRVFVATPVQMEAGKRYPVLYVLDGNAYFRIVADTLTRQSVLGVVAPAIVVAIGYPTDNPREVFPLRSFDLTPSPSTDPAMKGRGGGGPAFLRAIEEDIMPLVESRYPADPARRSFWGHSFGGLFVLNALIAKPALFANYALSSPSIWWNDREVLAALPAFAQRVHTSGKAVRVLLLSAADEQYRGADPVLLAHDQRLVDNASELAARLATMPAAEVSVQRVIFDGELHETVSPASISRTLRFALPVEK
jgi:predicted alpha/beta superfamily hydrolase